MDILIEIIVGFFVGCFLLGLYISFVGGIAPLRRLVRMAFAIAVFVIAILAATDTGEKQNFFDLFYISTTQTTFLLVLFGYIFTLGTPFLYDGPTETWTEYRVEEGLFGDWHVTSSKQDNFLELVLIILGVSFVIAALLTWLGVWLDSNYSMTFGCGFVALAVLLIEIILFLHRFIPWIRYVISEARYRD